MTSLKIQKSFDSIQIYYQLLAAFYQLIMKIINNQIKILIKYDQFD